MKLIHDDNLSDVLRNAEVNDLTILVDLITDDGAGRISLSSEACAQLVTAKAARRFDEQTLALIAEELSRFGGNSLANLFRRGAGVPYKEIVCDVAKHLKVPFSADSECALIEMAIISKVLQQAVGKMTEEQREELFSTLGSKYTPGMGPAALVGALAGLKLSGFGALQAATIVAEASATALLKTAFTTGATQGAARSIGALVGPIGWAITAIWTTYDLASPAYRVTVPCVIQIAYMRQKTLIKQCPACKAQVAHDSKFCSECGTRVGPAGLLKAE